MAKFLSYMRAEHDPFLDELEDLFEPPDGREDLQRDEISPRLREVEFLTAQADALKADLQGSCIHPPETVFETTTDHFVLRICAHCGLEEYREEAGDFEKLEEAHRTVGWPVFERIRRFDTDTMRRLIRGEFPETTH